MTTDEQKREFNDRVSELLYEQFGDDVAAWGLVLTQDAGTGDLHVIANHSAHHCLTLLALGILRLQDHIGESGYVPPLSNHEKAVLSAVRAGKVLAHEYRGDEDEQKYHEAFGRLVTSGYVEFDTWLPVLTKMGEMACFTGKREEVKRDQKVSTSNG